MAIFAADKKESGRIYLHDNELKLKSTTDALRSGLGLVPEDRKNQGIILSLSIEKNISISILNKLSDRLGFIRRYSERKNALEYMKNLSIKASGPETITSDLSGGNQQKVVLAKWLSVNSVSYCWMNLLEVDVGAKVEIYNIINALAAKLSIVLVSSEMMEVIGICDRILVIKDGEIRGELGRRIF